MIKVVSSREMREMDRQTIEDLGIPGVVLMEYAGVGTFRVIQPMLKDISYPLVAVFCGKGNNGGDGYVIARHLWDSGAEVRVVIAGEKSDLKGDALINFQILQNLNIPFQFVNSIEEIEEFLDEYPDLIVDALLGTGIKGSVYGFMKDVIDFINSFECPVVAVDVPSGVNSDEAQISGLVVDADVTVTMALPKYCHVFYPAKELTGELFIADIGMPESVRNSDEIKVRMVEKSDIRLPVRNQDCHKYQCGKVGIIAGSPGYTGAAVLSAQAALKIGAGLVILAVPDQLNSIFESKLTEVITRPYPSKTGSFFDEEALASLQDFLEWCDVLAIGPGLGRTGEVQNAVLKLLSDFRKPVILDADALFALANNPKILNSPQPDWVLTPHHGEFLRFLPDVSKEDLRGNPAVYAREFSEKYQTHLLLKGAPSLTANPCGEVFINSTGNPGLASGGTGDVLTGFVAGLAAQNLDLPDAAITANYLHGLCADEIVKEGSEMTLIAGNLINSINTVLKQF